VAMFRNDAQVNEVCTVLLERAHMRGFWTREGPTKKAHEFVEEGGPMSSGERVMLLVAYGLWNGTGGLEFAALMQLDDENLEAVGSLLVALATGNDASAIETWIALHNTRGA